MENPFKVLGEAFTAGLEKLHKRADSVEADVSEFKGEVAGFKDEMSDFTGKVGADVTDMKDRLTKLEAMFAPEAVSAVTDKVASAGNSDVATAAPTAPVEPEAPAPVAPTAPVVTEAPSGAVVTVDADKGETSHEDATGTVTTVPHDGTAPTAVDAANQPVEPAPGAVAEAVQATADAGVAVPVAQPVI